MGIWKALYSLACNKWFLLSLILGLSIVLSLQIINNSIAHVGPTCPRWSNYLVFQFSHFHLLSDHDLYSDHLHEHCFTFKYSPTFALLFGLFARLPLELGLMLWLLLSGGTTWLAFQKLPGFSGQRRFLLFCFVLFEWMVSVQGQQTNALLASMFILSFAAMEEERWLLASLLLVFAAIIKPFALAFMVLYLFFPGRWKMMAYSAVICCLLLALPLLVVNFEDLTRMFSAWFSQIQADQARSVGMSLASLLHTVTGARLSNALMLALGLIANLGFLLNGKAWKDLSFRRLVLAAWLVWVVIFNHKAESHTYVLAMLGMGIWFFGKEKHYVLDYGLLAFAFIGVSLIFSDFVSWEFREQVSFAYHLKALPSTILWLKILWDLYTWKGKGQNEAIQRVPIRE